MTTEIAVTLGGRTFTVEAKVKPSWNGDHENPPEAAEVRVVAISEGVVGVDAGEFEAIVREAGHDLDEWWRGVEDELIEAREQEYADAMERIGCHE